MERGIVLQANGEPYKPVPRALTTPFETELPASERRTVSQTISPAYLRAIEAEANQGKPRNLINFAETAREKDERIGMCAGRREGAVASLDWSVQPGRLGPDATDDMTDRAAEIASEATAMLERIEYRPLPDTDIGSGGFSDLLKHNESSIYYAVAPAWWVWEYQDGRWDPVQASYVHPRRIVWDENLHPRLYDPGANGPQGMWPGMELNPLQWTVDLGQVRPGYPMRDGYARACIWLYAYASFSWKDFVQYSEQFGTPFLLGYINGGPNKQDGTDPGLDRDRQTELMQIVSKFSGLKRAVIDGRDDIKALQVASNAKHIAPIELIRLTNEAKAILFLGGTQAVDVGDHATQATSKTHRDVELGLVQHDADHRSNGITRLLRNWYELNYADGPEYCPHFWLDASEPADLKSDLEVHKGLYEFGVELSKKELREHYGVQPPATKKGENGEEVEDPDDVVKKTAAPNPFASLPPGGDDDDDDDDGKPFTRILAAKPPDGFDEDVAGEVLGDTVEDFVKVADKAAVAARTASLDTAEEWLKRQGSDPGLSRFAEELSARMGPEYANVIGRAKFRPVVEGIYKRFKLDTNGWPKGVSFNFGPEDIVFKERLAGLSSTCMSKYVTSDGSQEAMKAFLRDWYGEMGSDIFKGRMKAETIQSFRTGMGDTLQNIHDWQARRIINTEVVRVRSYAEVQQFQDAGIVTVQWFATSLERCERCKALHGTQASVSRVYDHMRNEANLAPDEWLTSIQSRPEIDPEADGDTLKAYMEQYGVQPPAHPNCKCMLLYVG